MQGPLRENSEKEEKNTKNSSLEMWKRKGDQKNPLRWAERECSSEEGRSQPCKILESGSRRAVYRLGEGTISGR